jgi:hypothetical protein
MTSWSFKLDDPPDVTVTVHRDGVSVTISGAELNKMYCEMQDIVRREALRGMLPPAKGKAG